MADSCCSSHVSPNKGVFWRAVLAIVWGMICHVPIFSLHALNAISWIMFALMTAFSAAVIQKDYQKQWQYCALMLIGLSALFLSCIVSQTFFMWVLLGSGIILSFAAYTLSDACLKEMMDCLYAWVSGQKFNMKRFTFAFQKASTDRSVLLLVSVYWVMTAMSFLTFGSINAFVFDDACMALGIHQLAGWLKSKMPMTIGMSSDQATVMQIVDGREHEIKCSDIKRGMKFRVTTDLRLHFACCTAANAKITMDKDERDEYLADNALINPDTLVCAESILVAQEDAPEARHVCAHHQEKLLQTVMKVTLGSAVLCGLFQGIVAGSLMIGVEVFSLCMVISCPCVIMTIKPMIQGKFLNALGSLSHIVYREMPYVGLPNIMVFDRTHTLYEKDPSNPDGAYVLHEKAKDVLRSLREQGVTVYILSGHESQEHLQKCQEELAEFVRAEHIIFSGKYHDKDGAEKAKRIERLQRYGSHEEPSSWAKLYCKVKSIFRPYTVGMVGDGCNDIRAMEKADLAIAVAPSKISVHPGVWAVSNFSLEQKNLDSLDRLLQLLKTQDRIVTGFMFVAGLYHLVMLCGINRLLSGLTASVVASTSSSFCVLMLLAAAVISMDEAKVYSFHKIFTYCKTIVDHISREVKELFLSHKGVRPNSEGTCVGSRDMLGPEGYRHCSGSCPHSKENGAYELCQPCSNI